MTDEQVNDNPEAEAPEVISENETESEQSELEIARKESQKNLEGWQRTLAEFQNYKRRSERELKERRQSATIDVLQSFLPIMDDFERALANQPEDSKGQAWLEGVVMIHRKFAKLLEEHNVEVIDPVGDIFDPNLHQALGAEDREGFESGQVIETLQKGYRSGEHVLRAALVKVAN